MKNYDVIHIGNYTKDTIINKGISKVVDGGGFNYGARATVSFMDRVAVVTKLSEKDSHVVKKLEEYNIDAYPVYCAHSTCMTLDYYSDNPDERRLLITSLADSFTISDLKDLKSKAFILAPSLKGEVPDDVIKYLASQDAIVAIDAQGFIRILDNEEVKYSEWKEAEDIFPIIDILKVDAVEAEFITGSSDRYEAIKKLNKMGAREIILTYRDGAVVYENGNMYEEKFKPDELRGRSGRGDTSISSYTAARLDKNPADALKWAVALTSLKLEKEGPFDRTADDVKKFLSLNYK